MCAPWFLIWALMLVTVLGLVGAGGIGLQLDSSISTLAWTQVSLILLVILSTVIVSEWVSAKICHTII